MKTLLDYTKNTRAILPDSLRYIRSDVPKQISDRDLKWLLNNDIRTIIDLREEEECHQKRCPLENHPDFTYIHMPVTGGNAIPQTPADVPRSYLYMADEKMEEIIRVIENSKTNVLYFCNAGKDRTGVVSAILLRRHGMSDEYIVADYLESGENLQEMLHNFAMENPNVDIRVITPTKEYMEYFLKHCNL